MAISQKQYIEVNSRFPERISMERNLGGLVFTRSEPLSSAYKKDAKDPTVNNLIRSYNDGNLVAMDLQNIATIFGGASESDPGSQEYQFAVRYYSYSSPSGQTPSTLKFVKMLADNYSPYRVNVGYKQDAYVFDETDSKVYRVESAIDAAENTTDISAIMGKLVEVDTPTGIVKNYEAPDVALDRVDKNDNSFGSFVVLGVFTEDQIKKVCGTNSGYGTRYLCSVAIANPYGTTPAATIVKTKKDVSGADGTAGTVVVQGDSLLSAAMPMSIFAATDYDAGDEAPCHMFKQFANETPTVFDDTTYAALTKEYINFYGQTQSNGKKISFYQRGFNSDGTDTAIYCNEVWFKSRCITRLMDMFIGNERVPANSEGVAMVRYRVSEVCDKATSNGSFMPKTPRGDEVLQIRNLVKANGGTTEEADEIVSGIENVGYGIFAFLDSQSNGEYFIHYYVFYGTADSVRFVKGDDVMVH